ncbi:tobamovirus multiplication protein 1-like isoform x1 [Anaeramoeba flamelloides]|uniref:Tobamovirus multiplication protein 1-like isoform x1 n=1 Tax=Anaeramoeba flamelloides TaxID=1746091 RepID=A0AAV7YK80_9EUKA|nr:tobamovirus multiplication protein 1-like isoform x1 [Anaeramoeba flamelloides]KAJ6254198.1 tobamovirus multiplication protein 1-like isoform x1 [Anaeramoeba flamelloides]
MIILIAFIGSFLSSYYGQDGDSLKNNYEKELGIYNGIISLFLIVLFVIISFFLFRSLAKKQLPVKKRRRRNFFLFFILFYSIIFTFRGVWDLFIALDLNSLNQKLDALYLTSPNTYFSFFFIWYFLLEGLPISIITFIFHRQISNEKKKLDFLDTNHSQHNFFYSSLQTENQDTKNLVEHSSLNSESHSHEILVSSDETDNQSFF